jgi:XRE family transcriptional regulator, master regulator for biofilm formation
MSIGQKIKNLRTAKNLTLPQCADKAGISKGFLSQLENGETSNPSLDTLNKIASALDTTIATLLDKPSIKPIKIVPDEINPQLQEFIKESNSKGQEPLDEDVLQALYALQERGGKSKKTKDDWSYLYETIVREIGRE